MYRALIVAVLAVALVVGVMMVAGCPKPTEPTTGAPPNMVLPSAAPGGGNAVANEAPLPEAGMENMPTTENATGMAPENTTPAPETKKETKKGGKKGKKQPM